MVIQHNSTQNKQAYSGCSYGLRYKLMFLLWPFHPHFHISFLHSLSTNQQGVAGFRVEKDKHGRIRQVIILQFHVAISSMSSLTWRLMLSGSVCTGCSRLCLCTHYQAGGMYCAWKLGWGTQQKTRNKKLTGTKSSVHQKFLGWGFGEVHLVKDSQNCSSGTSKTTVSLG